MNSMPAVSKARRTALSLGTGIEVCPSTSSARRHPYGRCLSEVFGPREAQPEWTQGQFRAGYHTSKMGHATLCWMAANPQRRPRRHSQPAHRFSRHSIPFPAAAFATVLPVHRRSPSMNSTPAESEARANQAQGSPSARLGREPDYHFFFTVALAVLPWTAFAATVGFGALVGCTECAVAALVRRTPG
jgi:hypothetical protein